MATVREGNQSVLLVVDMQVGVLSDAWDATRIVNNVALAVERARAEDVPVIWIRHSGAELVHGSPTWAWAPGLAVGAGEPVIDKHYNSAFEQTTLEDLLAGFGATRIVLAGAATNWCIRATAYAALERGYDLTLVSDAHTTGAIEKPDGSSIEAEGIIEELNVAMTWVSYPGRSNGVATASEVNLTGRHPQP